MDAEPGHFPRILACGDSALSVELSDRIDEAVNEQVIALAAALNADRPAGVTEVVVTYRSLMIAYDPCRVRGVVLSGRLRDLVSGRVQRPAGSRRVVIPVHYGGAAGLDLAELAAMKELSPEAVVGLHCAAEYRVYMIGFAPGFAYLGGLPDILHTPRRMTPRQRVEAGSIGIGGQQASINSVAGPSGWRFIGRTPLRLFNPDRAEPCLLQAGDRVRFRPVDAQEALALDRAAASGHLPAEVDP